MQSVVNIKHEQKLALLGISYISTTDVNFQSKVAVSEASSSWTPSGRHVLCSVPCNCSAFWSVEATAVYTGLSAVPMVIKLLENVETEWRREFYQIEVYQELLQWG